MVKKDSEVNVTKTIEVKEVNGEKQVTVTTTQNGQKTVMIYTGTEAETFLKEHHEKMNTSSNQMKMEELEDMEFTMNIEGMEEGDTKKIIIVSSDNNDHENGDHETIVWSTEDGETHKIDINHMNVDVTDGEDGEPMKIKMSYTDENGKNVNKVMVIDKTEMAETMEDVEDILHEMNIDIDMDINIKDSNGKNVKTVVVSKKIIISEDDETMIEEAESKMFSSFSLSPNPSSGVVKLEFTPVNKGNIDIMVTGVDGNEIYTEAYNGKGKYSKTIQLNDYQGVVILTISQGDYVEVRKIIIE
jgi:hypothetical protein